MCIRDRASIVLHADVCRLSASSSVTRVGGRPPPDRTPGSWAVGRPTLHGGPVRLRPVRATPCFSRVVDEVPVSPAGQRCCDGRILSRKLGVIDLDTLFKIK